jgi:hypothetical protein
MPQKHIKSEVKYNSKMNKHTFVRRTEKSQNSNRKMADYGIFEAITCLLIKLYLAFDF